MDGTTCSLLKTYNLKLFKAFNHTDLAYELGIISHMVYKNRSAHRGQKYYCSMKKIDRHMHQFASLNILHLLRTDSFDDLKVSDTFLSSFEILLIQAHQLLEEVESNCRETVKHCLQQLSHVFFVPLHTFLCAVISRVWNFVTLLLKDISTWFENTSKLGFLTHWRKYMIGKNKAKQTTKPSKQKKDKRKMNVQLKRFLVLKPIAKKEQHQYMGNIVPCELSTDLGEEIMRPLATNANTDVGEAITRPLDINANFLPNIEMKKTDLMPSIFSNRTLKLKMYHIRFYKHCLRYQSKRRKLKYMS